MFVKMVGMSDVRCSTSSPVLLPKEEANRIVTLFKALAGDVRLELLLRIAAVDDDVCVCDIQDVGVSQATVSHHLKKLREAGLIDSERRGTWVHYWPTASGREAARLIRELATTTRP